MAPFDKGLSVGTDEVSTRDTADPDAQYAASQWSDATQIILSVAMTAVLFLATFLVIDVMLRSEYAQRLRGGQQRAAVQMPIRPIGQGLSR